MSEETWSLDPVGICRALGEIPEMVDDLKRRLEKSRRREEHYEVIFRLLVRQREQSDPEHPFLTWSAEELETAKKDPRSVILGARELILETLPETCL